MKKLFQKKWPFKLMLLVLSILARTFVFEWLAKSLARAFAKLNLAVNKSAPLDTPEELAKQWKIFMPIDQEEFAFKVLTADEKTAYVEIDICCPLRGTGNVRACYALMNYDRTLVNKVGGTLTIVASQAAESVKGAEDLNVCVLAIRKKGVDTSDLIAAYKEQ